MSRDHRDTDVVYHLLCLAGGVKKHPLSSLNKPRVHCCGPIYINSCSFAPCLRQVEVAKVLELGWIMSSGPGYSPQAAGSKRRYDERDDGPPDSKRQAIGAHEGPPGAETVYRLLVQSKKVWISHAYRMRTDQRAPCGCKLRQAEIGSVIGHVEAEVGNILIL